jgi:hypothetical protein
VSHGQFAFNVANASGAEDVRVERVEPERDINKTSVSNVVQSPHDGGIPRQGIKRRRLHAHLREANTLPSRKLAITKKGVGREWKMLCRIAKDSREMRHA